MRSSSPQSTRLSAAFTLMEMVVVVVIIGITAAMIIPEMKGTFQDALLRSAGRDLANAANLASSRAVSLNQTCRLDLNVHLGKYQIERQTHSGLRLDYVPLQDVPGAQGNVDSRISLFVALPTGASQDEASPLPIVDPSAPDAICFYPDGTADAAQIKLEDRDGYQLILQINPVTSRIHLSEPKHE